mmetsp:Transcript_23786/g.24001  ORF Transcript_23786/g.24001 Transcript_23786/m.24001 type:complete len:514 (+) Transcript_23786:191-1732(+)
MKLDVTCMRYLTKDDFRVLTAIELGMRNHELVPVPLIVSIAKLRHGGSHKILSTLLRHKLVAHAAKDYNGYRLSYLGYDILALRTLLSRGVIVSVGSQIGIGKESDIFEAQNENGDDIVLKIHRLGRTSFRAVRRQRDYMNNKSKASWLYMSRLAATKEFAFMKALHAHGFPTPIPFDSSRHVVAMSKVDGFPMAQIKTGQMEGAERIFNTCMSLLGQLAEHGLIHCDFNEFNLMVNNDGIVTIIDFPQMVSTNHPNASELFERDVRGLVKFFAMKMRFIPTEDMVLRLEEIQCDGVRLDDEVRASGFSLTLQEEECLTEFIMSGDGGLSCEEGEEGRDDARENDSEEENGSFAYEDDGEQLKVEGSGTPREADRSPLPSPPASTQDISPVDVSLKDSNNSHISSPTSFSHTLPPPPGDTSVVTPSETQLKPHIPVEQDNSVSEDEGSDGVEENTEDNDMLQTQQQDLRTVRMKVKRQNMKGRTKQMTRNNTKKWTKYGKIDRAERHFDSSAW